MNHYIEFVTGPFDITIQAHLLTPQEYFGADLRRDHGVENI